MAAMAVQHNMQSINANRNLGITTSQQKKSTEKLSSGYKINRAGDDAAGLAISEKMRGQIRGLNKASTNASDGISLIQTAEGGLNETHSILQRMRELAVQAATDTNTTDDRQQIQNEIDELTKEVDRIANTTEFNTKKLLNGDIKGAVNAKAGTGSIEGTFANSIVEIKGISKMQQFGGGSSNMSGVIRFEAIADDGKTDSDKTISVTAVNGMSKSMKTAVSFKNGTLTIEGLKISNGKVKDRGSFTFSVKNASLMKAGDVITVTIGGGISKSKQASSGKEALRFQVGANAGQEITLGINSMRARALGAARSTGEALIVTDQKHASLAINEYDLAIQRVSTERAKLGATQNRLEHTIDNLDSAAENTQSAESGIRDTDMASEMVNHSKNNILAQAGQSMLAQANQSTQGVLSLLG